MKNKLFLSVFVIFIFKVNSQNDIERAKIIQQTNVQQLNHLVQQYQAENAKALSLSKNQNLIYEFVDDNGRVNYLSGFDENDDPVYDHDDNVNAANTARVNRIWIGGSSGLNLDGTGVLIGHWEASGVPLLNHIEYNGKVTLGEAEVYTSHATHVAGTMIATGVDPSARGMASNANILAYRSNFDEAEIAAFGAAFRLAS